MEPINYRRAIRRRWPLILVVGVVCAVIGVLIPVHQSGQTQNMWQAQALAGVPPPKSGSANSTTLLDQIKFFAEQEQVYVNTAKVLGLKKGSGASLRKDVSLKQKKGLPPGSIYVDAKQPDKIQAAKLANTFTKQLGIYADQQLAAQYHTSLQHAQASVASLHAQLASVDAQIAELTKNSKKPGTKAKTPPTTTTTARRDHPTTTTAPPTTTTAPPTTTTEPKTTTTTTAPTTTSTTKPGATNSSTTTSTTSATTTSTTGVAPPTTGDVLMLAATSGTTSTTSPGGSNQLSVLQQTAQALEAQYRAALAHEQQLTDSGPPKSGFVLLQAAAPGQAKFVPASSNLLVHRSVRAGIGFLAGLLLGIALVLLLDGLDKRLRASARASEVFGLPVIAEIPRRRLGPRNRRGGAAPSARATRRRKEGTGVLPPVAATSQIAVVDAPASIAAEAYRRLRVSVMFAPAPRQDGASGLAADPYDRSNGFRPVSTDGGVRQAVGSGLVPTGGPIPGARPEPVGTRDVILVTSPSTERTESEVVLNLAAAYAEAGERVLIVSTTDLRSNRELAPSGFVSLPATQSVRTPAVGVPAGNIPENPTEQLPVTSVGAPGIGSDPPTEPVPAVNAESAREAHRDHRSVTVEEVVARCVPQRVSGVSKLQLGGLLRGPGELATRGNDVVTTAREIADVVIVDAPAVLGTPDAEALVRCVDAVLVVAESYFTTVNNARRSGELLRRVAAPTLGVVLTEVDMTRKELRGMGVRSPRPA